MKLLIDWLNSSSNRITVIDPTVLNPDDTNFAFFWIFFWDLESNCASGAKKTCGLFWAKRILIVFDWFNFATTTFDWMSELDQWIQRRALSDLDDSTALLARKTKSPNNKRHKIEEKHKQNQIQRRAIEKQLRSESLHDHFRVRDWNEC